MFWRKWPKNRLGGAEDERAKEESRNEVEWNKGNTESLDSLIPFSNAILGTTIREKNQKPEVSKQDYKKYENNIGKNNTEEKVDEYKGTFEIKVLFKIMNNL